MAISKVTIEALSQMANLLQQSVEDIMSAKVEMDRQLRSFIWDDQTGYAFSAKYDEDFKPLTQKLIPMINNYVNYIVEEGTLVIEYSGEMAFAQFGNIGVGGPSGLSSKNMQELSTIHTNVDDEKGVVMTTLVGVAGGLSAMWFWLHERILGTKNVNREEPLDLETAKEIEFYLTPDELFSHKSLDMFHRVAKFSGLPQNRTAFYSMEKDNVIRSLETGLQKEDEQTRKIGKKCGEISIVTDVRRESPSTHGYHYVDNNGKDVIWINPLWYKQSNVDNLNILATVMHEYEHKLQHDQMLRKEISKKAYNYYHRVSTTCKEQFDSHQLISVTCNKEWLLYYNGWQEVRSRKAAEIAREAYLDSFKPRVLYRAK